MFLLPSWAWWLVLDLVSIFAGSALVLLTPVSPGLPSPEWSCVVLFVGSLLVALGVSDLVVPRMGDWMREKIEDEDRRLWGGRDSEKEKEEEPPETEWLARLLGTFEVSLYTTLIAFASLQGVLFFLAWVGIKMATGWHRSQQGRFHLRMAFRGLVLNLVNLLIALAAAGVFRWGCDLV